MTVPSKNPLHLYRSLLREATYLFHPVVQHYHFQHIKWSFRRQQDRVRHATDFAATQHGSSPLLSKHDSQQLKRARKYLYMLQRANHGYTGALKNVLQSTFARTGKRRREMLKEILALPADQNATHKPLPKSTEDLKHWRPSTKFTTILHSQNKVHAHLYKSQGRIKPMPTIPEMNRWNRPFPPSRIKGIVNKWYAKHADLLLPPLQEKEWLDIYKLATIRGKVSLQAPARRLRATIPVFAAQTHQDDLVADVMAIVKTSPQAIEHQNSKKVRAIIGNPHNITNRYVRRTVLRTVLQDTPTVLTDPERDRFVTRWESGIEPRSQPAVCSISQQMALFE